MEYTEKMLEVGDWVHTQDGIGVITNVLSEYYQNWEKEIDETYRASNWEDNEELGNKIFGEIPKVGSWTKDIITMKRLCNHDCKPMTRTMCFTTSAYENDKISKKEMKEVLKILKDKRIKDKFDKYKCKYDSTRTLWGVCIPPEKAVQIKKSFDEINENASENLRLTINEIQDFISTKFDVNILNSIYSKEFNNATIHTTALPINSPEYYNQKKEQIFCKIQISKQWYDEEYLSELIKAQNLEAKYYDSEVWIDCGWDGEEVNL